MKLLIPEILTKANEAKTRAEKINVLRANDSQPLRGVLYLAFAPDVKWQLPEGAPPFKRDENTPLGMAPTTLYREARRLYIWVGSQPSNLTKFKRESLFIELLEGIHYTEADLLIAVKEKQFTKVYKTLKEDLIREAFPGVLPPEVRKETVPLEQK